MSSGSGSPWRLDRPGIFFGRVRGADVGVTFVPDPEHSVVYVTNIA